MAAASEALTITMPSDREVVMRRVFDAPRELLFDAYTKPEHLKHWLLGPEGWTMPVCEVDLRPGGAWHFVWRQADGNELEMRGEYREVTPPARIVNTEAWGWGGDWPETLNTVELAEEDGKTTVTTTIVYASKEARDAAVATGMKDGASVSYDRLEEYVRSASR
jgi:uncharacterized protein YndB with AHSA1/START domain